MPDKMTYDDLVEKVARCLYGHRRDDDASQAKDRATAAGLSRHVRDWIAEQVEAHAEKVMYRTPKRVADFIRGLGE